MPEVNTVCNVSVDDYIHGELESEVRHEYIGGQVYAMSGGSEEHSLICGNLHATIHQHLSGKSCKVFMADMKVRLNIAKEDIFYYTDIFVTCNPEDNAKYYKIDPSMIIEVLSPSTERLDRREKFLNYQHLDSLKEYILVDQSKVEVTLLERSKAWRPSILGSGDLLRIPSLDFSLPVDKIYEDIF